VHPRQIGRARPRVELAEQRVVARLGLEPGDLAALSFSPSAAFSQTPGPGAGRAIGATK